MNFETHKSDYDPDKGTFWPVSQDNIDFHAICSEISYERSRRHVAKGMGIRVALLDKLVKARRREIKKLGIHDEVERRFALTQEDWDEMTKLKNDG